MLCGTINLILKSGLSCYNANMPPEIPVNAQSFLLKDAEKRDRVTARRVQLLRALLRENYLSREALIQRVEYLMGFKSFDEKSWEDTFYRDMRVVKQALKAAGFKVKYSRKKEICGYYLDGEPALSADVQAEISGALVELDDEQIKSYRNMPPAQKFFQAVSMIDLGKQVSLGRSE